MGDKGPSSSTIDTQKQLTGEQVKLAKTQDARAEQLFNLEMPSFKTAMNYYETLASGDPAALARAVAPASNQIALNTAATKQEIRDTLPRGGAEQLAEAEASISGAAQRGQLTSSAYLSAFPALANLGEGLGGLSISNVNSAISAFSGASSSNEAAGQMQEAQKEAQLGFIGGLAQDAATIGATVLTAGAAAPAMAAGGAAATMG